jgi:HD superfamily phosphohydrolase
MRRTNWHQGPQEKVHNRFGTSCLPLSTKLQKMRKWWFALLIVLGLFTVIHKSKTLERELVLRALFVGYYVWSNADWIIILAITITFVVASSSSSQQSVLQQSVSQQSVSQQSQLVTQQSAAMQRRVVGGEIEIRNLDGGGGGGSCLDGEEGEKVELMRDVLYEYIRLSWLAKLFIDTPEFQELRDLRQLGLASYVFPSANHTRFEHSIGVYHLARWLVSSLFERQPRLWSTVPSNLRTKFVELVALAGLLHDVGHYAGSHCFDEEVAPKLGLPNHEERGVLLIKKMVKKYDIPLEQHEVEFICGMILGNTTIRPAWIRSVLHNCENEIDCDKWDYLMRDSYYLALGRPIQVARLIHNTRVLRIPQKNDHPHQLADGVDRKEPMMVPGGPSVDDDEDLRICYNEKVFLQVCDVFQTRYRLFREVYRHRVVVGVDEMMGELMRSLTPVFRIWLSDDAGSHHARPTDASIAAIKNWLPFVPDHILTDKIKTEILQLWERIRSRRLYKVEQVQDSKSADIHIRLGLSSLADDPVEKVWFFNKRNHVQHIRINDVTKLLGSSPRTASETIHYKFTK